MQTNFCPQLGGSTKTVGYCSLWQRFIMVHLPNFWSKMNRISFHFNCVIIAKILNSCDESDCCESSHSCGSSDCSLALNLIRLHNILGFYIFHSVQVSYIIPHLSDKCYMSASSTNLGLSLIALNIASTSRVRRHTSPCPPPLWIGLVPFNTSGSSHRLLIALPSCCAGLYDNTVQLRLK